MDSNKDSMKNVVAVALSLCLVSAIIVSASAVALKPMRLANKALDRNKNILIAAGLFEKNVTAESKIDELFDEFEVRLVVCRPPECSSCRPAPRAISHPIAGRSAGRCRRVGKLPRSRCR